MAKKDTDLVAAADLESRQAAVREQFLQMGYAIPESEDDGGLRILEQIAGANSVDNLDDPWNARDALAFVDRAITITGLVRKDSDFADGLGLYLLVDLVDHQTGEATKFTSGSASLVAQLVKAYAMDALPLDCIVRKAAKPTKNGYWPQHLEMLRGATAATA